jgi:RNase P subunit RPR2
VRKAFVRPSKTGYGGFPTTCVECGGSLSRNDDYDYNSEWWISYTCDDCGTKFRYMPSDMGQTLPALESYKTRHDEDRRRRFT